MGIAVNPLLLSLLFAVVLLAQWGVRQWLAGRQIRHVLAHRDAVPAAFADRIPLTAHQRAADYTVARVRLGMLEASLGVAWLVALTFLGGLQWLHDAIVGDAPDPAIGAQVAFVAAVFALGALLELPFGWIRQFRIDARFGFNRMTQRLFWVDTLKGLAVGAALALPLLALVLWLMQRAGDGWWLWVWAVWVVFNVAVLLLFPTVIAPLFNRFEPLPPGPVRTRVEALLARCGFAARGLFVMDGSRRSSHGNAYFTGMGRARRIVFFDTLLARLAPEEIEAVLAHELGHFRHRHIAKRIALGMLASLAALALLGWLSRQPWFYQGLGLVPVPGAHAGAALVLFLLVAPVFGFVAQPLLGMLSRRHEYEADAFAARETGAAALIAALVKLYEDNAATLTPDRLHSIFHDSHPPAAERVRHLERLAAAPPRA